MRSDRTYADGSSWQPPVDYGTPVDQPRAGFFRVKLSSQSIAVAVEVKFGPPIDPVTGEELDRSWRWLAFVNGEPFGDFDQVWPKCAGDPITEAEYQNYCARQLWARENVPDSAYAEPGRKHDLLSTANPLPF